MRSPELDSGGGRAAGLLSSLVVLNLTGPGA